MNRRDVLKRIAAAGLVAAAPEMLTPERRFWQLDQRMIVPQRLPGDDTAWVQWHLDHLVQVPFGRYDMHAPAIFRNMGPGTYEPFEPNCFFALRYNDDVAIVVRDSRDAMIDCKGARWHGDPDASDLQQYRTIDYGLTA